MVDDFIDIVDGHKRIRIHLFQERNQFEIFVFVHNRDDLCAGLGIECAGHLIDGCTAVQLGQDKLPDFLLFFGNDADPFAQIEAKDKIVLYIVV